MSDATGAFTLIVVPARVTDFPDRPTPTVIAGADSLTSCTPVSAPTGRNGVLPVRSMELLATRLTLLEKPLNVAAEMVWLPSVGRAVLSGDPDSGRDLYVSATASLIVRSAGSMVSVPVRPAGAVVSTVPVICRPLPPLTSTSPPSPPCRPPRAVKRPATTVLSVDSSATWPPLPVPRPSALIRAPAATCTARAESAGTPPDCARARARVVPTATVPPPPRPLADTRAAGPTATVPVAASTTVPPWAPGAMPSARTAPSTVMLPPTPATTIAPGLPPAVLACNRPPALTRFCTIPSAARAVSWMVPPSAWITPVFVTSAVPPLGARVTCRVTSTLISPSPYRSTVCASAPASTTRPMRALMTPEFATCGATSAANPVAPTVIVPALLIRASALPGWSNTMRPAMKFRLVTLAADTTKLCASTWLPAWNTTPLPLTSTTCPLAWMRPAICDGSGPVTRFSVTLLALGCWKATVWPLPTSKLRQSTAARWLVCATLVRAAVWLMLADPATTAPPCGLAPGAGCATAGQASNRTADAPSAVLASRSRRCRSSQPTGCAAATEAARWRRPARAWVSQMAASCCPMLASTLSRCQGARAPKITSASEGPYPRGAVQAGSARKR